MVHQGERLTFSLKSAGIRQSYPNSTRIPNCTPVMGIGAPTLYVNLSIKTSEDLGGQYE